MGSKYRVGDKDGASDRVVKALEDMRREKCTLQDVIETVVRKNWGTGSGRKGISFVIGYEYVGKLNCCKTDKKWDKIKIDDRPIDGKIILRKIFGKDRCENGFVQFCECLGEWEVGHSEEKIKVFYFLSIENMPGVDSMYFGAINDAYYRWLRDKFIKLMNAVGYPEGIFKDRFFLKKMTRDIEEIFQTHMQKRFQIDLSVITELSGNYYEGSACQAEWVFYFGGRENLNEGVVLAEGIEVGILHIRKIRKLLQMGQNGQCLLAVWDMEKDGWVVVGLHKAEFFYGNGMVFRILGHMNWRMEFNRKKIISYECGKYFIDCEAFKAEHFRNVYKKTFQKDLPHRVEVIFDKALQQVHGTVVVILEKDKIENEVKRLLEESVGIGLANWKVGEEFFLSMTEIDGAVCMDSEGNCYGMGIILDGSEAIKGKAERGARYNSTRRYIKKCQGKECGIIGMAVVISEDRSIDIFSTEDVLEER